MIKPNSLYMLSDQQCYGEVTHNLWSLLELLDNVTKWSHLCSCAISLLFHSLVAMCQWQHWETNKELLKQLLNDFFENPTTNHSDNTMSLSLSPVHTFKVLKWLCLSFLDATKVAHFYVICA